MAVESNPVMEHSCRPRFNSTRPKFTPTVYGIIIGSFVALVLRGATTVQVPHWPSPMDKAGA
eukprot:2178361-Karenia_brevis.AAC.1